MTVTTAVAPEAASTRHARRRLTPLRLLVHVLVWIYALLLALPLLYLILSSLKNNTEIFSNGFGLPPAWRFSNFADAWTRASMGQGLINSFIVTAAGELLILLLSLPAAYAVARSTGWLGRLIERTLSLGFLIPAFAALVPTVLLSIAMGLFRTREFLVLDYAASGLPLSVILIAQYMRAIPAELEESARVDGANRFQIITRVYTPLVMPVLSTVIVLNFINIWNEYIIALVISGGDEGLRTVQVSLPALITLQSPEYGLLAAGTLISLVPIYLIYLILQKRMENALMSGALKG
jgi:multiple sugar transport system permease protein